MAKKCTTIYIDDTSLRLLVTSGYRVKKWAEVKLESGMVSGTVIADASKLGEFIKSFLKINRVGGHNFIIGISAVHCLTRQIVLPSLPKNLLDEAVVREARRLLPLPPEQLYLSWRVTGTSENNINVFLVALRRSSVDSIYAALKIARVKPMSLLVKPLALARLVKENALLVDIQASDFDICILIDGIPQLIRTIPFASRSSTQQAKLSLIMDEIDRTIKFYADNNPQYPLKTDFPMYISGEIINRSRTWNKMIEHFGFRVIPLTSMFERPAGFDPGNFLVNESMSIHERNSLLKEGMSVTSLNLLPEEFRIKPVKWERALALPAVSVFLGLAVPLTLLVTGASSNIVATRAQLDASSRILQDKQALKVEMKAEFKELEAELLAINTSYEAATQATTMLASHADMVNGDLDVTMRNVSSGMILKKVSESKTSLVISGEAPDEALILAYARALDDSERFKQTVVTNISRKEGGQMSFVLTLMK